MEFHWATVQSIKASLGDDCPHERTMKAFEHLKVVQMQLELNMVHCEKSPKHNYPL